MTLFHVRLQAAQGVVPLLRDHFQAAPGLCQAGRVQRPEMFPALVRSVDDARV